MVDGTVMEVRNIDHPDLQTSASYRHTKRPVCQTKLETRDARLSLHRVLNVATGVDSPNEPTPGTYTILSRDRTCTETKCGYFNV